MRYIYDNPDEENQGPSIISDEAESLVDTIAAALMRGDTDYAYTRAQSAINKAGEKAREKAKQDAQNWAEQENRMRAEFAHGKAEFHTLDGLIAQDKIHLRRDEYYVPEWKRACRSPEHHLLSDLAATKMTPIPIRTYEFTRIGRNGLPIYEERAD
jgi:hypothetical protein